MLKKEVFWRHRIGLVSLTQQVFVELERELKLVGFWESIPARNKLRADIQKTLLHREFSKLPGLVQNRALGHPYFQNNSPATHKEAKWLPAPERPFNLTMRLYTPCPTR